MIWHGHVIEVSGDTFWAEMTRSEDDERVQAQFSMAECGLEVETGDIVRLDGEKNQMTLIDMPLWTREELDAIMKRAAEQSRKFRGMDAVSE